MQLNEYGVHEIQGKEIKKIRDMTVIWRSGIKLQVTEHPEDVAITCVSYTKRRKLTIIIITRLVR